MLVLVLAVGAAAAPSTKPGTTPGTGSGLTAVYVDNRGATVTRVDGSVDFNWRYGAPTPALRADDFSVRWSGEFEPRYSETYTLSTISDDGVRLWVDGRLVIDNWTEHPATEDSASLALAAGRRYTIKMEFFERVGLATARLFWSSPSQGRQIIPKSQLYPIGSAAPPPPTNAAPSVTLTSPATGATFTTPVTVVFAATASDADGSVSRVDFMANGTVIGSDSTAPYSYSWSNAPAGEYDLVARATDDDGAVTDSAAVSVKVVAPLPPNGTGTGLSGLYFDDPDFSGTSFSRVDPQVDFAWGYGAPAPLAPDDFSVRWSGELEPRYSGTYTLSTVSDDGVRLWLDGRLVIDNWTEHAAVEDAVSLVLDAGRRYPLRLEFFERTGLASARLLWASALQPKEVVPKTQLYPAAAPAPPPENSSPSVALTSPDANASYSAPAAVSLAASASDSDGTVSRVEFLVNGTVIATDTAAPYAYTWSNVPAGEYTLTARATDDDGAGADSGARTIKVTAPPPASGSGTGLHAEYFDDSNFSGAALTRVDARVDFTWGLGAPAPSMGADDFSVRWSGELEPQHSETYTFSTFSDDGVRLWIDGRLVVDNWTLHAATEDSATMPLVAGRRYQVRMEFFERGQDAVARLLWSSPSQPKQPVPQSQLYPAAAASPAANTAPSVSLTAPAANATFTAPASVSLAASASDGDGTVTRVDFLSAGAVIGTDTTPPYTFAWGSVPAGAYTLSARATDDDGASSVSQPVSISVTDAAPQPPPPPSGGDTASLFVAPSGSDAGSCSKTAPCRSFQRAYAVASPGQVVEIAGGTYPNQQFVAVAGKTAPNVVFRPAAGARVIVGGMTFGNSDSGGPDFITVRGIETSYKGTDPGAGNQRGVHVGPGSSYITLENIDAGSVTSWFADHLTIRGGDYGPCDALATGNVCGNNKQDVGSDILIEGAYFHDLEYDPSNPDAHYECMYINGGLNVTIRNNRFERCAIFDLFVTISGPDAGRIGHENLTIENNWFGPATNGFGVPSRGWSSLSVAWCQNSSQPAYRNVRIRNNSFGPNAGIEKDLNADGAGCRWQNVSVTGNIGTFGGCQNGWTYANNMWLGTGKCSTSDGTLVALPYVGALTGDYHLTAGSAAEGAVPGTLCPATDFDGQPRPSPCDAGADER